MWCELDEYFWFVLHLARVLIGWVWVGGMLLFIGGIGVCCFVVGLVLLVVMIVVMFALVVNFVFELVFV